MLNSTFKPMCFILGLFIWNTSLADEATQQALRQTQQLLTDPKQRDAAIESSEKARRVHTSAEQLTGGNTQQTQKLYDISSEVFSRLVQESQGDATKMQKLLDQASQDPRSFYDRLFSEKDKAQVRELATEIEKTNSRPSSEFKP